MSEWEIIKDLGNGFAIAVPKGAVLPASAAIIKVPKPATKSTSKK